MTDKLQRGFWPIAALAAPLPLLHAYFAGNWYAFFHLYSVGMTLGVVSFTWLVIVLALSARIGYFDRLYGHDRVLVFHVLLAGMAIAAGFLHSRVKEHYFPEESLQMSLGEAGMVVFICGAVVAHLFMSGQLRRWLPFTGAFITKLRGIRLLDYSRIKLLHNFMALALMVIIVHILLAHPSRENVLRRWTMGGWGALGIGTWLYFKIIRRLILHRKKQTITAVEPAGPGITRLSVSLPARGAFRQRAGQFAYLRILSDVTGIEEHPFTLSSAPGEDILTFTIKDLGDYTARLPHVMPGTKVLLDGPYGIFTPDRTAGPHLFIAGGIGITPFLSILKEWDRTGMEHPVLLAWSVRNERDMCDRALLNDMAARHAAFEFIPVITGGPEGKRLDTPLLEDLLRQVDTASVTAWLCGPERMRAALAEKLKGMGIPRIRIRYERFSV